MTDLRTERLYWPKARGALRPELPRAACRSDLLADPLFFFPDTLLYAGGRSGAAAKDFAEAQGEKAKAVCRACPEFEPCEGWVMENLPFLPVGIWAATDESQRRQILLEEKRER